MCCLKYDIISVKIVKTIVHYKDENCAMQPTRFIHHHNTVVHYEVQLHIKNTHYSYNIIDYNMAY